MPLIVTVKYDCWMASDRLQWYWETKKKPYDFQNENCRMIREYLFVKWCFLLEARVLTRGLVSMGRNFNTQLQILTAPDFCGTWRWPPTQSSAEVKESVQLYLYSPCGSLRPVLGWTLLLPLQYPDFYNPDIQYSVYKMYHMAQRFKTRVICLPVLSGSLSLRHGAPSGCGWRSGLQYGG